MNGNLSATQVKPITAMTKAGAMPVKDKFDGPAPIKTPQVEGIQQPNKNLYLPKPGFF